MIKYNEEQEEITLKINKVNYIFKILKIRTLLGTYEYTLRCLNRVRDWKIWRKLQIYNLAALALELFPDSADDSRRYCSVYFKNKDDLIRFMYIIDYKYNKSDCKTPFINLKHCTTL